MSSAEGEKEDAKTVESPAAPVFGSAATFTGTGFGGFTLNASVAGKESGDAANGGEEEASSSGNGPDADPEAECQAEFKPLVTLDEVATKYVNVPFCPLPLNARTMRVMTKGGKWPTDVNPSQP